MSNETRPVLIVPANATRREMTEDADSYRWSEGKIDLQFNVDHDEGRGVLSIVTRENLVVPQGRYVRGEYRFAK